MRCTFVPWIALILGLAVPARAADVALVATADTEGHVAPCQTCPVHAGRGGLARRATALAQLRAQHPALLLVDAGNALIGDQSIPSRGAVIVDAYNRLGYDAINVTPQDLFYGPDRALPLLAAGTFVAVSATIVDERTGQPVFAPYVVKLVGGKKVAILGACEPPAGLEVLPQQKQQLAGLRVRPVAEAIAQWLPKAKGDAEAVVLLYYGTASGLKAIHRQFGKDVAAICAGGVRPGQFQSADPEPRVVLVEEHGKQLGVATLGSAGVAPASVDIAQNLTPDPALSQVLAFYERPTTPASPPASVLPPEVHNDVAASAPTQDNGAGDTGPLRRIMRVGPVPAPEPTATATPAPAAVTPPATRTIEPPAIETPAAEPTAAVPPAPASAPAAVPPATKPRFCTSCGAKLAAGAKFCTSCGAKVQK